MDTLTSIKVFRQVVESGTFVAAAERLDFSTAMVSKHVMHVEKRLGVRLLNRNSRRLSLTEAGRVYFERCKTILEDLEETELELGSLGSTARGTLRVTVPTWFAGQRLAEFLAQYRERYPEIMIDISFEDRVVDLIEEGYDLALRVTAGALAPALIARPVRLQRFPIAASPEYIRRHGEPKVPEDLINHDCAGSDVLDTWSLSGPEGERDVPVRVVMRFRSNAALARAHAVALGTCLSPLPPPYFADPAFNGRLGVVLPDYSVGARTLYVVYVSRKHLPLKIRTFIDSFVEFAAKIPTPKPVVL
jgi:DNA-binding transcriptional LysR family regulator